MLHALNKVWTVVNGNRSPPLVQASLQGLPSVLGQDKKWLDELLVIGDLYRDFAQANGHRNGEPAVALVLNFSTDFEQTWRAVITGMRDAVDALIALGNQALDQNAQAHYATIHAGRPTLETIANRLRAMMAAPPGANLGRIGELSRRNAANDPIPQDYLDAGNPHREAGMIANINAARAPLLVQLGNQHVDRVAAGVPGAVKVKIGVDFDAMTRKESK